MDFLAKYRKYKNIINMKVRKASPDFHIQNDLHQECYVELINALNLFDENIDNKYAKEGKDAEFMFVNNRMTWVILRFFEKRKLKNQRHELWLEDPDVKENMSVPSPYNVVREKEIVDLMYEIIDDEITIEKEEEKQNETFKIAKKLLSFKLDPPTNYHKFNKKEIAKIFDVKEYDVSCAFDCLRQVYDIAVEI